MWTWVIADPYASFVGRPTHRTPAWAVGLGAVRTRSSDRDRSWQLAAFHGHDDRGVMLAAYASSSRTLMQLVLWSLPVVVILPIALGVALPD
jgi:hypothetical protein